MSTIFTSISDAAVGQWKWPFDPETVIRVLPTIEENGKAWILKSDEKLATQLALDRTGATDRNGISGFDLFIDADREVSIGKKLVLTALSDAANPVPGESILLQRIIRAAQRSAKSGGGEAIFHQYLGRVLLATPYSDVIDLAKAQERLVLENSTSRASLFARSAHYMGSKANLGHCLLEAVSALGRKNPTVLDLMCGSGAASGAFSRHYNVIASDAQEFCRKLAIVHGGGFNEGRARETIEKLRPFLQSHFLEIEGLVESHLDKEEQILRRGLDERNFASFMELQNRYPRMGSVTVNLSSDVLEMIEMRRTRSRMRPYVMFTFYYANLFFGIRQAAEIDSLRFAIDQLTDRTERDWALGALICAASACAYTYGGHFAQPKLDPSNSGKTHGQFKDILFSRGMSVVHEFEARLISLAAESERVPNAVVEQSGPWGSAMSNVQNLNSRAEVVTYFDPPYTREEYSRYYHVLEELIRYSYPVVSGKANVPDKSTHQRFASEFFSRTESRVSRVIEQVIDQSLANGWPCIWSYSDKGNAKIRAVIDAISARRDVSVEMYSTPYVYRPQGKAKATSVLEYLVAFSPLA